VSKKKLTYYQHFSTAYRQTCCETSVKVSKLNYENPTCFIEQNLQNYEKFYSTHYIQLKKDPICSKF